MSKEGECMHCGLENPPFLHGVYYKYKCVRHFCTACLLSMYPGSFCPVCFHVYDDRTPKSSQNLVTCNSCRAKAHPFCVDAFTALELNSTSTSVQPSTYMCPSCSDPEFRFFNFHRDEETKLVPIDDHLAPQLLAASIISQNSMRRAALLTKVKAQIKAKEAAQARKKAKEALYRLAQFTSLVHKEGRDRT